MEMYFSLYVNAIRTENNGTLGLLGAYWISACARRPCDGLMPRPRSPTDCLKLRNWNKTKRFTDALCSNWEQQK
jgi:hypothetical protein